MPAVRQLRLPSYRHHRPSGLAVVTIAGKDQYLGPWKSKASRVEYDRLIAEWLAGGRPTTATATAQPADFTVKELLAAFWTRAQRYYVDLQGKTTKELACFKYAMSPLRSLYAETPVREFGPLSLKAVRQKMIGADWSRTYTNHQINRVRHIFKWGVENELVPAEVYHGLQAIAGLRYGKTEARETEPIRCVPDAFVDAIQGHVAAQVWAMVQLQRLTGMRAGEVVVMRGCDLDTAGDVWIYSPAEHKTA